jgi:hypothetical protein
MKYEFRHTTNTEVMSGLQQTAREHFHSVVQINIDLNLSYSYIVWYPGLNVLRAAVIYTYAKPPDREWSTDQGRSWQRKYKHLINKQNLLSNHYACSLHN